MFMHMFMHMYVHAWMHTHMLQGKGLLSCTADSDIPNAFWYNPNKIRHTTEIHTVVYLPFRSTI